MIVDPDVHPTRTIYYAAGMALQALEHADETDLATLHTKLADMRVAVAADTLVLALDLLFLFGLVELSPNGGIQCS